MWHRCIQMSAAESVSVQMWVNRITIINFYLGKLDYQSYIKRIRRESLSPLLMKRIPTEGWMSLGDLRHHVPWEKSLLKGGRGRQKSHKLSFSLASEWRNARTTLPPNFKHHFSLQIHNCLCCNRPCLASNT